VARPTVHVSEAVWGSEVREESQELQQGLRELGWPGPECVPITRVGGRIGLLGVDEPGELGGIANEEDGGVYRTKVSKSADVYDGEIEHTVEDPVGEC
jgi:hypothetical protein